VDNPLTKNTLLLSFDGLDAPVQLVDCAHLVEPFSQVCNGWGFSEISASNVPPFMVVSKTTKGYRIDCTPLSRPRDIYKPEEHKDECAIICAMIADFSSAFGRFSESLFALHGAGLVIGGHLVVFPAMGRSGKSTMSVHLANKRYQYVLPEDDKWAPHGERADISAVVLLDRDPDCVRPVLSEAKKSEGLKRLIGQNFDPSVDISTRFKRLYDLAGDVTCHHLRYAETGDAVPLLFEAFGA